MNKIETCVLNSTAIAEAENMLVCAARLTQRGHSIKCMRHYKNLRLSMSRWSVLQEDF